MITRLQIINHMLSVIGESGISNPDSLHPSVTTARRILETEDMDFQSPGWWFNKERGLPLVQDNRGEVHLPANTLDMKISAVQYLSPEDKLRYVKRGTRVYDSYKHTFAIGRTLHVDITTQLDIEDLPAVAASYVMHRSAYSMYVDDDGDTYKTDKLEQRVSRAWQQLRSAEMQTLATNGLDTPIARRLRMHGGSSHNPNIIGGRLR